MRSNKIKTHACRTHRGSPWLDLSLCGPLRRQIFLPPAEVATLKTVCYSKRASEWRVLILSGAGCGAVKLPHAAIYTYRWYLCLFYLFTGFKQHNKEPRGISCSCFSDGHHQFAGNSASCTRHFPAKRDFDKSARATGNSGLICIQTAVSPWFVNMSSRCSVRRVLQVYKASLIRRHERRWQWWREKVRHDTVLRSRNTTSSLTFLAKTQALNINHRGEDSITWPGWSRHSRWHAWQISMEAKKIKKLTILKGCTQSASPPPDPGSCAGISLVWLFTTPVNTQVLCWEEVKRERN